NSSLAVEWTINRVRHLALGEIHLTLVVFIGQRQGAALASHLERLHQVDDVHLREVSANDSVGSASLGHLLERDLVDGALDALRGLTQEKRLFDEIVDRL